MSESPHILSADEMKQLYGSFYDSGPKIRLDRNKVPERFWPLLPYAEFWGIPDDSTREMLVRKASPQVQRDLKKIVAAIDNDLDEWLAGPEADEPNPSDEYIAFSAMRMAAYYI